MTDLRFQLQALFQRVKWLYLLMAIAGVFRETVPNSKSSLSCHLRVVSVVCNGGSLQIRHNFFALRACLQILPVQQATTGTKRL